MKINFANIEVRGSQPSVWYVYLLTVKENEDAVACGNRNMKKGILFFFSYYFNWIQSQNWDPRSTNVDVWMALS